MESGWAFTVPEHRNKGLSSALLSLLMAEAKNKKIFAVTGVDNFAARRLLEKAGFAKVGSTFKSGRTNKEIQPFIKKPP